MDKIVMERSLWIPAPRERVWGAVSEPEQLGQWFLPPVMAGAMKRGDGGKILVSLGPMEADVAVLEAVEPPRQVTSRSLPDGLIATTYTLDEKDGGTQVTITMSGFEALPEGSRHDRLNVSGTTWEKALENLKAHVVGGELPHPFAGVAPLFGYWRRLETMMAVERSIWIKASRERVWQAITEPGQIQKWFSPGSTFKATGEQPGSRLYVENPENGEEMYVQILDVIEPPSRLVSHSKAEPHEPSFVTSYTLTEENGGTRLTLTYTGYEGVAEDARPQSMEENTFGFGMMLQNIKAHVEGTEMPFPFGF
jgi:uncharacterized protein YndB with AHSA1/START domain